MMIRLTVLSVLLGTVHGEPLLFKSKESNFIQEFLSSEKVVGKKPDFCNKLDCPEYSVVETGKGFELREYGPSAWVSTSLTGIDYKEASRTMFMRLFEYISGENKKKEKIAMTAPVVIRLIPGQGPACENNFTMSFYISKKVSNPPMPSDSTVYIEKIPEPFRAYVRQFSGYVLTEGEWVENALKLEQAIGDTSKYRSDFFFTAGYNSPFQLLHRHNEIWLISPKKHL